MSKESFKKMMKMKLSEISLKYLLKKRSSKGKDIKYGRLEIADYHWPYNKNLSLKVVGWWQGGVLETFSDPGIQVAGEIIDCVRFGQYLCLNAILLKFTNFKIIAGVQKNEKY